MQADRTGNHWSTEI